MADYCLFIYFCINGAWLQTYKKSLSQVVLFGPFRYLLNDFKANEWLRYHSLIKERRGGLSASLIRFSIFFLTLVSLKIQSNHWCHSLLHNSRGNSSRGGLVASINRQHILKWHLINKWWFHLFGLLFNQTVARQRPGDVLDKRLGSGVFFPSSPHFAVGGTGVISLMRINKRGS